MLGKRIKAAREAKGWTQSYLGELLGSDGKYISRIELGKSKPSLEFFVELTNVLECSTSYLLQDSVHNMCVADEQTDYVIKGDANHDIFVLTQKYGKDNINLIIRMIDNLFCVIENKNRS